MKKSLFFSCLLLVFSGCGDFKQTELVEGKSVTGNNSLEEMGIPGDLSKINEGGFSIEKLLLNHGYFLAGAGYEKLHQDLSTLDLNIEKLCILNLGSQIEDHEEAKFMALKKDVRESWKNVMLTYHKLEAFKYGPISTNGEEKALSIYSWPLTNACRIDLEIAKISADPSYSLKSNVNLKSLSAIESILYTQEGAHNCPTETEYLKVWKEKKLQDRRIDQCRYLKLLSKDLLKHSSLLQKEWRVDSGNYPIKVVKNKVLGSPVQAVNVLAQSLFFLEKSVKDSKVGTPVGLVNCAKETCPENIEHSQSQITLEALLANLEGFSIAFNGMSFDGTFNGMGFDDYLRSEGQEQVSLAINEAIANATTAIKSNIGKKTFEELVLDIKKADCLASTSQDRQIEACALYQDIKGITNLLKNNFLIALKSLQAPKTSQGDMD